MDVADEFQKIGIGFTQKGLVTVLEEIAVTVMMSVVKLSIPG